MTLSQLLLVAAASLLSSEGPSGKSELPAAARGPVSPAMQLVRSLAQEPRMIGTHGYERAMREVEAALLAAQIPTTRGRRKSGRAIPLKADLHFFEDSTQEEAFAGLRERWDPESVPTMPLPMAYAHNPESASVRAPILHIGNGLEADFQRIAGLGVSAEGCVVLAEMALVPARRTTTVREIAARAAQVGAVGLLIAPLLETDRTEAPLRARLRNQFVIENTLGEAPLAIPTMPIRAIDAESLVERLRIKRVRGGDGKAVPTRLGPGPVEASLRIECPVVVLDAPELICGRIADSPEDPSDATILIKAIPLNEIAERPLGGAFDLAAAVLAASDLLGPDALAAPDGPPLRIVFGAFAIPETSALLGAEAGLLDPMRTSPARAAVVPGMWSRFSRVQEALGADGPLKLDAAREFVAYECRQQSETHASGPDTSGPPETAARLLRPL